MAKRNWKNPGKQKWSAHEDMTLELLLPNFSYPEIALKLGRSVVAVQHRASYKGLSQRVERRAEVETSKEYYEGVRQANLFLSEDDLSAFLPECDEPALHAHHGTRTYYKEKRTERRKNG